MAEEVKNQQQNGSAEAADSAVEDNPSAGGEETPQNAEGKEAEAGAATADEKSINPENQTFWKDSVDAKSVDLSQGEILQEEATKAEESPVAEEAGQQETGDQEPPTTKTEETNDASTTPPSQEEEGKGEEETQPAEQEAAAAQDTGQKETPKAEESPAAETEPAAETPAAEVESQPETDEQEPTTAKTEETEDSATTPPLQEEEGKGEGEEQPAEQESAAAQDFEQEETPQAEESPAGDIEPATETPAAEEAGQEETQTDTEEKDTESEQPQAKGKVISIYEYLRKKRLLTGIGILLLVAGSIGYTVVPDLRSPGTITSALLGGPPESAYNMKFFLPLNVGYEKAQFVKVTIALELIDQGLQKELDKNLSHLRKEVIDLILTKSPKEVRSSNGKRELSREITRRINNYLSKDCIKGTYFTELVIL
jgi:flagellar basal body-associated protein FliL